MKACYAYLEQGLLDSLKEHPIDRHLLANVDVFKLQVLARPCCKRLAARLLSLAKDKVAAGSRQWKTALDLRKGNVRAQRYVQLLLKAVPALGTDVADFGLKASEAMGHLKGMYLAWNIPCIMLQTMAMHMDEEILSQLLCSLLPPRRSVSECKSFSHTSYLTYSVVQVTLVWVTGVISTWLLRHVRKLACLPNHAAWSLRCRRSPAPGTSSMHASCWMCPPHDMKALAG